MRRDGLLHEELLAERLSCSGNDNDHGDIDDEVTVHGEVLPRVGVDLLAHYLGKGTRENMSVFIVAFPASPQMLSVSDEASSFYCSGGFKWKESTGCK